MSDNIARTLADLAAQLTDQARPLAFHILANDNLIVVYRPGEFDEDTETWSSTIRAYRLQEVDPDNGLDIGPMPNATDAADPDLAARCPTCKAEHGQVCRTSAGKAIRPTSSTHVARKRALR
jgi:hypothetical protein